MSLASVILHLITPESVSLFDPIEEGVFDRPDNSELLHEFLIHPTNALIVAMSDGLQLNGLLHYWTVC
jgi:hypothetical protein